MLPKKGRREITVDGVLYHYIVKGYITMIFRNSETGEVKTWHQECKPKWGMSLEPSDVANIIRGDAGDGRIC